MRSRLRVHAGRRIRPGRACARRATLPRPPIPLVRLAQPEDPVQQALCALLSTALFPLWCFVLLSCFKEFRVAPACLRT